MLTWIPTKSFHSFDRRDLHGPVVLLAAVVVDLRLDQRVRVRHLWSYEKIETFEK